jgi:hypothetical protein
MAAADSMAVATVAVVDSTVAAAVEGSTAVVVAADSMAVAAATAVVVDTANSSHEQKARSNERAFFLPIHSAMPHSDSPA